MTIGGAVDFGLMMFVGLLLVASIVYFKGMLSVAPDTPAGPTRVRLLSFIGLLVTAAIIFLGGIWPSYYTIVAILVIPAIFVLGTLIFRPGLISEWPKVRIYLLICVAISAISWVTEVLWLIHVHAR